jgi:hypothetical protein
LSYADVALGDQVAEQDVGEAQRDPYPLGELTLGNVGSGIDLRKNLEFPVGRRLHRIVLFTF